MGARGAVYHVVMYATCVICEAPENPRQKLNHRIETKLKQASTSSNGTAVSMSKMVFRVALAAVVACTMQLMYPPAIA